MTDADLRAFLTLRRHLRIAHHIPGRVRLKVAASVFTELGAVDPSAVERILNAVDGIEDVRINKAAGSAIVVYAVDTVDPDSWQILIHGEDADALRVIQGALNGRTPQEMRI